MYQRYPGGAQSPEPPFSGNNIQQFVPPSVMRAVRVMYLGLAASLVGIAVDMTALSATRSAIRTANPTFTTAQVNSAVHVEIGLFIASGLIGGALWLWMAQSCKAGKGWARIVSTVLFAIDTLANFLLGSSGGPARIYGLIVWLIGLTAVILLWQRSSSEFFRARRS